MTVHKRIAAILMIAVIGVTVAFASFYVVYEYEHECVGDGCPICFQIDAFEAVVKTCDAAPAVMAVIIAILFIAVLSIQLISTSDLRPTPVSLKVKLSN